MHRRIEPIYSKQSERPKTTCQTDDAARSEFEQTAKKLFARLPTAFRPS